MLTWEFQLCGQTLFGKPGMDSASVLGTYWQTTQHITSQEQRLTSTLDIHFINNHCHCLFLMLQTSHHITQKKQVNNNNERLRERERERERDRDRDRDRQRHRHRQRHRERQRQTDRQTDRQTETETQRESGSCNFNAWNTLWPSPWRLIVHSWKSERDKS